MQALNKAIQESRRTYRWWMPVLLCCTIHCHPALAQAPASPAAAEHEFHFVVLGDSQFHDPVAYNRLIDDLVWLQPAFVVQVGDLINGYNSAAQVTDEWQRFQRQIAPLESAGIPFVPVAGNHDVYGPLRTPDAQLTQLYEQTWGQSYHQFIYRNSSFFVLNSDEPGAANGLSQAQRQWLTKALRRSQTSDHRFVFLHRPADALTQADALHRLFVKYKVQTVFYGHHHHYHYREQDGVQYVMTNAAADSGTALEAVGSFDHLLQVSVRDERTRIAVIRADGIVAPESIARQDNYDLFALQRDLLATPLELSAVPDSGAAVERFQITLQLHNSSSRSVQVYPSCSSADDRWHFTPQQLPTVVLGPNERSALELIAQQVAPSESLPECTLAFPFQVADGRWFTQRVSAGVEQAGP